jgi:hypothetical protein
VHFVSQWSLQHALHDAWQSVESFEDVQLALQLPSHLPEQSVLQSSAPGLGVHLVVQSLSQLEVQFASADALHCELHCCSSLAAQHASKLFSVHCVVQLLWVTSWQFAVASTSMLPHAAIPA